MRYSWKSFEFVEFIDFLPSFITVTVDDSNFRTVLTNESSLALFWLCKQIFFIPFFNVQS